MTTKSKPENATSSTKPTAKPAADKLPTSLRTLSEQRAALAKLNPGINVMGRPRVHSARPSDIKVFIERNIRPINWDTVEDYKLAILRGDRFPPIDVTVELGEIVLKHGYHRTLAAQAVAKENADFAEYELELREFKGNSADTIILMLNSQDSLAIDPISRAEAYLKLYNQNMSHAQIAARLGARKSGEHVGQQLILVEAEESVKALVRAEKIKATTVITLIKEQKQGGRCHVEVIAEMMANAEKSGKTKATPKHRSPAPEGLAPRLKMKEVQTSLKSLVSISSNLRTALTKSVAGDQVELKLPADKVAELLELLDKQAATAASSEEQSSADKEQVDMFAGS